MLAGQLAQTADCAAIDFAEPTGLANATPFADVVQNRQQFLGREVGIEEWSPLAFGETILTNAASEHPTLFAWAVATGHGQIFGSSFSMFGAVGIEAAEA